jgi:hypothetical protein
MNISSPIDKASADNIEREIDAAVSAAEWRIENDRSIFSGGDAIVDQHDVVVAHLEPWSEDAPEKAKANARFILRACKSHKKLLAACWDARLALSDLAKHPAFADDEPEFNEGGIGYEAKHRLDAAIADAERA